MIIFQLSKIVCGLLCILLLRQVCCDLASRSLTSDPYREAGGLPESPRTSSSPLKIRTLNMIIIYFHSFHDDGRATARYFVQF